VDVKTDLVSGTFEVAQQRSISLRDPARGTVEGGDLRVDSKKPRVVNRRSRGIFEIGPDGL
jgi:hypothetical protein